MTRDEHLLLATLPPGWHDLVRQLDADLVQIVPDYQVNQAKEKFGGLRFYTSFPTPVEKELMQRFRDRVHAAEAISYTICDVCGQQGELRSRERRWWRTLCEEHNTPEQPYLLGSAPQWWHRWHATGREGTSITITIGPTSIGPDTPSANGLTPRQQTMPVRDFDEQLGAAFPEATYVASFTEKPDDEDCDLEGQVPSPGA